jgi:hypothetical protein
MKTFSVELQVRKSELNVTAYGRHGDTPPSLIFALRWNLVVSMATPMHSLSGGDCGGSERLVTSRR